MTVAGAEPERAAKNAHARIMANDMPPLMLPTIRLVKSTKRLEIPPWVIKFPAKTKKGMAIMLVVSIAAKSRWVMIPNERSK
ncbi:hypothetical protein SDC9_71940 [bioreactor metagenome]|uniref:Uncharacterized protein n=1 Tax=bioreactor metagenome TaxID=1076179 RepID=A0A644YA56_9ZZZZ